MVKTNIKYQVLLFFITSLIMTACHKDVSSDQTLSSTKITQTTQSNFFTDAMFGIVLNENGNAVQNATILLGDEITQTNELGTFNIKNASLNPYGTQIFANANGYYNSGKWYVPSENFPFVKIIMSPLKEPISFDPTADAFISANENIEIKIPKNSILTNAGLPMNEEVSIFIYTTFFEDKHSQDRYHLSQIGRLKDGITGILPLIVGIEIEILDQNGNILIFDTNQTIEIKINTNSQQTNVLSKGMDLFYQETSTSEWTNGGAYTLDLKNLIIKSPASKNILLSNPSRFSKVCGQLFDENASPLPRVQLLWTHENILQNSVYTDNQGGYCALLPKDLEIELHVNSQFCNETLYSTNETYDNIDFQKRDITIPVKSYPISTVAFCNGEPIGDYEILFSNGEHTGSFYAETSNTNFSGLLNSTCTLGDYEVQIFSHETQKLTEIQSFQWNETDNSFVFELCDDCEIDIEIIVETNNECDISTYNLIAEANSTSPNLEYLWSNGGMGKSIEIDNFETYCVTVYNNLLDCEEINCIDIIKPDLFDFSYDKTPTNCGQNDGTLKYSVVGGQEPYMFNVTGPNGYKSNQNDLSGLQSGLYSIEITDQNRCSENYEVSIENSETINVEIIEQDYKCDDQFVILLASSNTSEGVTYSWSDGSTEEVIEVTGDYYCVTITDSNGCESVDCIDVQSSPFSGLWNIYCEDGFKVFNTVYTEEFVEYVEGGTIEEYILDDFNFKALVTYNNGICNFLYQTTLPEYKGEYSIHSEPASCQTCNDGVIEVEVDWEGDCFECTLEKNVYIYKGDNFIENLSNQAEFKSGTYYVGLKDKNGCFVKLKEVII